MLTPLSYSSVRRNLQVSLLALYREGRTASMESTCSRAVMCVLFSLSSGSFSLWLTSVPRRTWMNSSRFEMNMERKRQRSRSGLAASLA